jgi:hypothetical protein
VAHASVHISRSTRGPLLRAVIACHFHYAFWPGDTICPTVSARPFFCSRFLSGCSAGRKGLFPGGRLRHHASGLNRSGRRHRGAGGHSQRSRRTRVGSTPDLGLFCSRHLRQRGRDSADFSLAPVSLMKNPGTSSVDITGLHPNDTGTRRTSPPSGHPYVSASIPALVSWDPDVTWSRCPSNHSHSCGRRGRDANHRLLRSSDDSPQQHYCTNSCTNIGHGFILICSFRHERLEPDATVCSGMAFVNWENYQ